MAFTIQQRVFFSGTKMLLRQETGEFVRRLSIGNNWTTIRVASLCAIVGDYPSTQNLALPWAMGMCSGLSGYSQNNTTHFVGWSTGTSPLQTYTANSSNPYYTINGAMARKVLSSVATSSTGSTNVNVPSTVGTIARKGIVIVDVTKGATTFASNCYTTATTAMQNPVDITVRDFLESLIIPGTPTVQGIAMAATSTQTLTGTEITGNLDCISLYWGGLVVAMEVYAMAVYRMI